MVLSLFATTLLSLFLGLIPSCLHTSQTPTTIKPKLLIIDTFQNSIYNYRTFKLCSETAGFTVEQISAPPVEPALLDSYQNVFLFTEPAFFNEATKDHVSIQKTVYALRQFSQKADKTLGIILLGSSVTFEQIHKFLSNFLPELEQETLEYIARYFAQPNDVLSSEYDTSLHYKNSTKQKAKVSIDQSKLASRQFIIQPLPVSTTLPVYPLGFLLCDKMSSTRFFISTADLLLFSEIEESIALRPLEDGLYVQLVQGLIKTIQELNYNNLDTKDNRIPVVLTKEYQLSEKNSAQAKRNSTIRSHYHWIHQETINAGWLDIEPFVIDQERLEKGIQYIIDAQLNLLWIRFNPEFYLSEHALAADKISLLVQQINTFTHALKKAYGSIDKQIPRIFVNFDLTTNFSKRSVVTPAVDFYGKQYDKIPTPLDYDNFWRSELIEPFDKFVKLWECSNNGVPLGGIFLDLEFYHAPDQLQQYTNLLDFSDISWQAYCLATSQSDLSPLKTTEQRMAHLLATNNLNNYKTALQQGARDLGVKIRDQLRTISPAIMIGAYSITLPQTWFLTGFLSGLSSPQDPIILATFNINAYGHLEWLKEHDINCFHIPVILFSKFRNEPDFALINSLRPYHDGVWFNRFSRLLEQFKPDDWWDLEHSSLESSLIARSIGDAFNRAMI